MSEISKQNAVSKAELIALVSGSVNMTKSQVESVLNAMLNSISKALADDKEVRLTGFGSFRVRTSAARMGKNPKTGEQIQVAASRVASFKPGQGLKDTVNHRSE